MINVLDRKVIGNRETLILGSIAYSLKYVVFIIRPTKQDEIVYESEDLEDCEIKFKEF